VHIGNIRELVAEWSDKVGEWRLETMEMESVQRMKIAMSKKRIEQVTQRITQVLIRGMVRVTALSLVSWRCLMHQSRMEALESRRVSEVDALKDEVTTLTSEYRKTQESLNKVRSEKEVLTERLSELLEDHEKSLSDLEHTKNRLEKARDEIQERVAQLETDREVSHKKLAESQEFFYELTSELNACKDNMTQKQQEWNQDRNDANTQRLTDSESLADEKKEKISLKSERDELASEVEKLNKSLNEAMAEQKKEREEYAVLASEHAKCERESEKAEEEDAVLREKLADAYRANRDAKKISEAKINTLDFELAEAEGECDELHAELELERANNAKLRTRLGEINDDTWHSSGEPHSAWNKIAAQFNTDVVTKLLKPAPAANGSKPSGPRSGRRGSREIETSRKKRTMGTSGRQMLSSTPLVQSGLGKVDHLEDEATLSGVALHVGAEGLHLGGDTASKLRIARPRRQAPEAPQGRKAQ